MKYWRDKVFDLLKTKELVNHISPKEIDELARDIESLSAIDGEDEVWYKFTLWLNEKRKEFGIK